MSERDPVEDLREAIARVVAEDAPALVEEARDAARTRARAIVEEALVDELVRAVAGSVERDDGAERPYPAHDGSSARGGGPTAGDALWVYCVLDARDEVPDELEGIEGAPVLRIVERDLAALVSLVPLADYDDERLRDHLNDIEWVERTARAHEDVLEQVLARATVVPLRLCTIYRDDEGVCRFLRDERDELRHSLDAVAGRAEWGLKLFADATRLRTGPAADAPPPDPGDGAGYLARKQRDHDARATLDELVAVRAEDAHRRLAAVADAARTNPLQRPEVHGHDGDMILNGVYLVPRSSEPDLVRTVEELRSAWEPDGFAVVLTGPWPAYNFVSGSPAVAP